MAHTKPKWKVTALTIDRDKHVWEANWKVPGEALDQVKHPGCFFSTQDVQWQLHVSETSETTPSGIVSSMPGLASLVGGKKLGSDKMTSLDHETSGSTTSETTTFSAFKGNFGLWNGKKLTRRAFYPYTEHRLSKVQVRVRGVHYELKDGGTLRKPYKGSWSGWASYSLAKPYKPEIELAYSGGDVTLTVTSKDEGDKHEWVQTRVYLMLYDKNGKPVSKADGTAVKTLEHTITWDISNKVSQLATGGVVKVQACAVAQGLGGPTTTGWKTLNVAYPAAATISGITCTTKSPTGKVKVALKKIGKYTTGVQLQRRNGVSGSWSDVDGAVDDGTCKALYDSVGAADPQPGERIYYRVKSTRHDFAVYSAPMEAECLFTKKKVEKAGATVGIVGATPNNTGTSATVIMGFSDSTDNTGCELLWSLSPKATTSTVQPSSQTFTGKDSPKKAAASKYDNSRTVLLDGLTPNTTYYLWMRRYREIDSDTIYSGYSDRYTFLAEPGKDSKCGIISCAPAKDGESIAVTVGYTEESANTGTELSWSESSGAWTSTSEEPQTAEYTAAGQESSNAKWDKQVTLTILSLTPGKTYYIKARRYLESGGSKTYTSYSALQKAVTESAADDTCGIISSTVTGSKATIVIGINEDNENTGTEITWATDKNAWKSNVQPNTMDADWDRESHSGGGWAYEQTSYLMDLEPDTTYYVKARRYLDSNGNRTHGDWSKIQSFKTPADGDDSATNDECTIISIVPEEGGRGASVLIGWKEDTANTGTELTWSDDERAWWSNEQPNSLNATWSDIDSQSSSWPKTQTINIRGLELGTTYYFRARRYLDDEGETTYSPYSQRKSLKTPDSATNGDLRCGLVSATPNDNGTSVTVVVGWSGDHSGTEVSWSDDPDAWDSTEQPEAYEFDTVDATRKSTAWAKTSTVIVRGLEEGVTYYFKARTYLEGEDRQWSPYSSDLNATPVSAPEKVVLTGPESIPRGEPIELYWSISGELEQKRWSVHEVGKPKTSLATGGGAKCHGTITPARYGNATTLSVYVEAGCGGDMTASEPITIGIADIPSCEVAVSATVTAKPATFEVYSDTDTASVLATLYAGGITVAAPDGDKDQIAGDTLWTSAMAPAWTEANWSSTLLHTRLQAVVSRRQADYDAAQEGGDADEIANALSALNRAQSNLAAHSSGTTFKMSVPIPNDVELIDTSTYTISVRTQEPIAGLTSPLAESTFKVAWAHQAPVPSTSITVTPNVEERTVTIALAAPSGAASTDTYEVYRKNASRYELVASALAFDAVVTDRYAPYGAEVDLDYRIVTRTIDGDFQIGVYEYEMPVRVLRFDWQGEYIELPWNLEYSDSYAKTYESRSHMDGAVNGYFEQAVSMSGSYSTDINRAEGFEQVNQLRRLGEYPGAVFCRTQLGLAFQCNAEVDGVDFGYLTKAMPAKISVSAMDLADTFRIADADITEG